jgi:hypothetical protein
MTTRSRTTAFRQLREARQAVRIPGLGQVVELQDLGERGSSTVGKAPAIA